MMDSITVGKSVDILYNNYWIPIQARDRLHHFLLKYSTKNSPNPETISGYLSRAQNLARDLRSETFVNSKGKIAEYLVANNYNQLLAGDTRTIEVFENGRNE